MLHAAHWKYRTQKVAKKSPYGRHRTALLGYIFATKAAIDNQKKLVKQQYLLQMSPQYGELQPTSGWDRSGSLGHPCKFNGFRVLAALLHGTLVVGVSQTLQRWTEGATYIRQDDHHVGHWPTFLVLFIYLLVFKTQWQRMTSATNMPQHWNTKLLYNILSWTFLIISEMSLVYMVDYVWITRTSKFKKGM